MVSLIGYTGFVGSNILANCEGKINNIYNSKNIKEAYNTNPDLLIYAGVRAEKYQANNNPELDSIHIQEAQNNISRIRPRKLVLISTIDVLKTPINVDESCPLELEHLQPYGYNRASLELWVRKNYPDAVIIRLPALFGYNIRKNFIYDYLNYIPYKIKANKFIELSTKNRDILDFYALSHDGYYQVNTLSNNEQYILRGILDSLNFNALYFTDSRNSYQFYNLKRLWRDINIALDNHLLLWHASTEPIIISELYHYLEGKDFENIILGDNPINYNFKTEYCNVFGGKNGYICDKEVTLIEIKKFVDCYKNARNLK